MFTITGNVAFIIVSILCEVLLPEDDYSRSPRAPSSKAQKLDEVTASGDSSGCINDPFGR